ncbi:hypothetical protein QZL74_14500 [Burkholderia gladioli pv. alliicola]
MGKEATQFSSERQPRKRTPRSKSQRTLLLDALKAETGLNEKGYYRKMVKLAMGDDTTRGDVVLAKEVFMRIAPPAKPVAPMVEFAFPEKGTPVEQVNAVLAGVATGKVSPDVGQQLVNMIRAKLDVLEISELADRLAAIEKQLAEGQ